jgi:hypothetical protein
MLKLIVVWISALVIGGALAQDAWPVALVTPDGTHVPFVLSAWTEGGVQVPNVTFQQGGSPAGWGRVLAVVGGATTPLPIDLIARLELVSPGEATVWRYTLRDGRVFDAPTGADPRIAIAGVNQFGLQESLTSRAEDATQQRFIGIVFDPSSLTDTVYLANGDVLHGSVHLAALKLSTPYGTLTIDRPVLERVIVGGSAGADLVLLRTGDRISGLVQDDLLQVSLEAGGGVAVPWGDVLSVTFFRR